MPPRVAMLKASPHSPSISSTSGWRRQAGGSEGVVAAVRIGNRHGEIDDSGWLKELRYKAVSIWSIVSRWLAQKSCWLKLRRGGCLFRTLCRKWNVRNVQNARTDTPGHGPERDKGDQQRREAWAKLIAADTHARQGRGGARWGKEVRYFILWVFRTVGRCSFRKKKHNQLRYIKPLPIIQSFNLFFKIFRSKI